MAKNIVIFSDGTGQAGGLLPDETRSNVYKLYRAARVCPDTTIDPAKQVAFYDVGLGSKAAGGNIKVGWWRRIYNVLGAATGLGITQNIIDCYAAILRVWEPGDRIYLVGFSRGAYTVRCVGAALALCGIPTRAGPDQPLKRDPASAKALAAEAIRHVYQFGAGKTDKDGKPDKLLEGVRHELADQFRARYAAAASADPTLSNAYPYFIGVWDTVAALGLTARRSLGLVAGAVVFVGVLAILGNLIRILFGHGEGFDAYTYWRTFGLVAGIGALVGVIAYLAFYVRFTTKSSLPWYKTLHLTGWKMVFYSTVLNQYVQHARHALSIDENRKDFKNVPWTVAGTTATTQEKNGYTQLVQMWFAGVHSDIGGSYIENEARLSDIALTWMIEQASRLPEPMVIDPSMLQLWPSAAGPQHDERKNFTASWPGWFAWLMMRLGLQKRLNYTPWTRVVPRNAPLHPSVIARFNVPDPGVLHYDLTQPYRPEGLRLHRDTHAFYASPASPAGV